MSLKMVVRKFSSPSIEEKSMKNESGTRQQAARPNADHVLHCIAFQCVFWSIRKQACVSSLAIASLQGMFWGV